MDIKYIRTATNIFEVVGETSLVYRVKGKRDPENVYSITKKTLIFKYGSTVISVINRVIKVTRTNKTVLRKRQFWRISIQQLRDDFKKGIRYYGAIWVEEDNGVLSLKSVAEVNEGGELCLLK